MSDGEHVSEALIGCFERSAGAEPIIAACLISRTEVDQDQGFPRTVMPWRDACEYLRGADGDYDDPVCIAWTDTRVLMPVIHEMGRQHEVWCITAPRSPSECVFPTIYDCSDPNRRDR
jgi:hypothetical protein